MADLTIDASVGSYLAFGNNVWLATILQNNDLPVAGGPITQILHTAAAMFDWNVSCVGELRELKLDLLQKSQRNEKNYDHLLQIDVIYSFWLHLSRSLQPSEPRIVHT